jgi:hypothetical protein
VSGLGCTMKEDEASHILVSFAELPPVIFWTRRDRSSPFKSVSCFWSSTLHRGLG